MTSGCCLLFLDTYFAGGVFYALADWKVTKVPFAPVCGI